MWYYGSLESDPVYFDDSYIVGRKNPNEFGIFDMSGFQNQWCWEQGVEEPWYFGSKVRIVKGGDCHQLLSIMDDSCASEWGVMGERVVMRLVRTIVPTEQSNKYDV